MIKRSIVGYAILVFVTFMSVSMSLYLIDRMIVSHNINQRNSLMTTAFESIDLDDAYIIDQINVSGDHRVRLDDKSTAYLSTVTLGHNASPADTLAEITSKLAEIGYSKSATFYQNTEAAETFFNKDGQPTISVNIIPKVSRDMEVYGSPTFDEWQNLDKTAGPSYITIKVYLKNI